MPSLYGQATIGSTSQTADLLAANFRVVFNLVGSADAISQADNTLAGRDRLFLLQAARSTAQIGARLTILRCSEARLSATAFSVCQWTTILPAIPTPIGQLFLEGKPLKEQRLPKGKSFSLAFTIMGKRLKGLQVKFALRNLRGETLLEKAILVAPGGVCIDEFIENPDKSQAIAGFILLLPHQTQFLGSTKELELNYVFSIGNGSSREHLLESNFINFYTV